MLAAARDHVLQAVSAWRDFCAGTPFCRQLLSILRANYNSIKPMARAEIGQEAAAEEIRAAGVGGVELSWRRAKWCVS
jgi:hypothetical protein